MNNDNMYKLYLLERKYYKSYNNLEKRNLILKKLKKQYNKIGGKFINNENLDLDSSQNIINLKPELSNNQRNVELESESELSNDQKNVELESDNNQKNADSELKLETGNNASVAVNEASNRIKSVDNTINTTNIKPVDQKIKMLMNGLTLVSTEIPEFGPFIAILIMMVKMIDSVSMITDMLTDSNFLQLSQFTIDGCNFDDFKVRVTNHYNENLKNHEEFNKMVDYNYNKIKDIIKSVVATEPVVGPLVVTFFDSIFSYELLCDQFNKQTKITIKGIEYDFAPYLCDTEKIKKYVCSRIDNAKQYLQNKANQRKAENDNQNQSNSNSSFRVRPMNGGLFDSLKDSLKSATESIKNTAISIGKSVMPLAFPFIGLVNIGQSIANEIGNINLPPELLNLASKPALMLLEKSGGDVIILNMVTSIVDSNIDNIVKFIKTLISLLFSLTIISDIIKETKINNETNIVGGDKNVKFNLRKNKYKSFIN